MPYETKNNSGTLGENERKESDRHPDKKGKALIDGQWFWISAWEKEGNRGPFLSLSFEPMTPEQVERYASGNGSRSHSQRSSRDDDGCPGGTDVPRTPKRAPSQAPPRQEPPFGSEPMFTDADVPFRCAGRQQQDI